MQLTTIAAPSLVAVLPYDILVVIMASCPLTTKLALRACCHIFNDIYTTHRAHLNLTQPSAPLRVLVAAKLYAHTHLTPSMLALDDLCEQRRYSPLLLAIAHTPLTTSLCASDVAYLTAVRSRLAVTAAGAAVAIPARAQRAAWNWQLRKVLSDRQLREALTVYELWELEHLHANWPTWIRFYGKPPHLVPIVDDRSYVWDEWCMKVHSIVPANFGIDRRQLWDAVDVVRIVTRQSWGSEYNWLVMPELGDEGRTPKELLADATPEERGDFCAMQTKLRAGVAVARRLVPEIGLTEVFERLLEFLDEALAIDKTRL